MEHLQAVLLSPQLQLAGLAILGTATLEVLVAVWAAASRRHWFVRALGLWGAIAILVPIRAYEPALLFAISSPLTVAVLYGWQAFASRRASVAAASPANPPSPTRFRLSDLFLLLVIVGLSLAVLIEVGRHLRPIAWIGLVAYVAALIGLGVASHAVVFGKKRRLWTYAGAAGAIAFAIYLILSTGDWLKVGDQLGMQMMLFFPEQAGFTGGALTIEFAVAVCLLLLLFRLAAADERSVRRRLARGGLGLTGLAGLSLWAVIYWQMLWLTPLPSPVTDQPNHFVRIMAIASEVAGSKLETLSIADVRAANPNSKVPDRLELLYSELLLLLDAPNSVVLPPPALDTDGTAGFSRSLASIQAIRSLASSLRAEADHAAATGNVDRAVAWNLANIRLGAMLSRGGTTVDYLVGMAVEANGTMKLAELRARLTPAQSQAVIAAIERALIEHQTSDTVLDRDIAYWERWEGWTARLDTVLAHLQGTRPGTDASSAAQRRLTESRLLQADLAVRLFRHDQGHLPHTLGELAPKFLPEVLLDPYSDQPFRYRPAGNEFVLYSVGADRIDNGGRFGNLTEYHAGEGYDLDLDTLTRP